MPPPIAPSNLDVKTETRHPITEASQDTIQISELPIPAERENNAAYKPNSTAVFNRSNYTALRKNGLRILRESDRIELFSKLRNLLISDDTRMAALPNPANCSPRPTEMNRLAVHR